MNRARSLRIALVGAVLASSVGIVIGSLPNSDAAQDGTLTVSPATGRLDSAPDLVMSGMCSDPTATYYQVLGSGAGFPANTNLVGRAPLSTLSVDPATGGYDVPLSDTITDYAQTDGVTITAGTLTFDVQCVKAFGSSLGDFFGSVTVDPTTPAGVGSYSSSGGTTSTTAPPTTTAPTTAPPTTTAPTTAPPTTTAPTTTPPTTAPPTTTAPTTTPPTSTATGVVPTAISSLTADPPGPLAVGRPVAFIAQVTPQRPPGQVQFSVDGVALGVPVQEFGTGTFNFESDTISTLSVGTHTVEAAFTPTDPTAFASSSATMSYVIVNGIPTSTVLSVSPEGSEPLGATTTLTATVSPDVLADIACVAGTVQFTDNGSPLDDAQPVAVNTASGMASLTTGGLVQGPHTLGATFVPASTAPSGCATSTAATVPLEVEAAGATSLVTPTSTALTVFPASPQNSGTPVGLSAQITPASATGSVEFLAVNDQGVTTSLGVVLVSSGVASMTSALPAGSLHLVAVYTPDTSSNSGSVSNSVPFVIISLGSGSLTVSASKGPSVHGTTRVGSTLSCLTGTWSGSPKFTYQWLRDGKSLSKKTKSTYVPAVTDLKHKISCRVTATNAAGKGTATSKTVTIATGLAPHATTTPSIKGTPAFGAKLSVSVGKWSPSGVHFKYVWKRNGAAIRGATASTYRITGADLGRSLTCVVTATLSGHSNGSATTKAVRG